jgi:hypothetical protein
MVRTLLFLGALSLAACGTPGEGESLATELEPDVPDAIEEADIVPIDEAIDQDEPEVEDQIGFDAE